MTTNRNHPQLWVQQPSGVVCFLAVVLAWLVGRLFVPEQIWEHFPGVSRLSGYLATGFMLVPYFHILLCRYVWRRKIGSSRFWLSCHIAAAYLGFSCLLLHCRARADSYLTLVLLLLVWTVMLSGVIGFYGQKRLYKGFYRLVPNEYGLERLEAERGDCLDKAYRLLAENQVLSWKKIFIERPPTEAGQASTPEELVAEKQLSDEIKRVATSESKNKYSKATKARAEDNPAKVIKTAATSESRNKYSKAEEERAESVVCVGMALHQILAFEDLQVGNSGRVTLPSNLAERRWVNRQRVRMTYPDFLRDVPQPVAEFYDEAIDKCLSRPLTLWSWPWARKESDKLYESRYKQILALAGPANDEQAKDRKLAEAIWGLVEKRRMLDFEYRLHAVGRLWLLFHGPAALALLVLVIEHIAMSMRFGGF